MWIIRQEQIEAFRRDHRQRFEDDMVAHLVKFAPKQWQVIGDQTGREVIRLGMKQAGRHGFNSRGPVRLYVDLMFVLGSYFDTDPQLPWAASILQTLEMAGEMVRAQWLFNEFKEYAARVLGSENRYFTQALRHLNEIAIEDLIIPGILLEDSALRAFQTIYPQVYWYLGEGRLKTIIQQSFAVGLSYGFNSDKAMLLMVGLSCFMGHGFTLDPLCGWIGRRMDGTRFPDADKRTEELYGKALLFMKYVLGQEASAKK